MAMQKIQTIPTLANLISKGVTSTEFHTKTVIWTFLLLFGYLKIVIFGYPMLM